MFNDVEYRKRNKKLLALRPKWSTTFVYKSQVKSIFFNILKVLFLIILIIILYPFQNFAGYKLLKNKLKLYFSTRRFYYHLSKQTQVLNKYFINKI